MSVVMLERPRAAHVAMKTPAPKYKFHPLVEMFPRLDRDEITAMAADIRRVGNAAPFLKVGEFILDDQNRCLACIAAEVELTFREWDGGGSMAEVIARLNLPRLHLDDSRRAALAVPIADSIAAESLPRRIANLKTGDKSPKTAFSEKYPDSLILGSREISESCGEKTAGKATERAAKLCHVSRAYVELAKKIRNESPEVFENVRLGRVNLSQAKLQLTRAVRLKNLPPASAPSGSRMVGIDDLVVVGDCLKVMPTLPRRKVRCVFADPPYNNGFHYDNDPTSDKRPERDYLDWCLRWMRECAELLTPDGSMFVLIDDRYSDHFGITLRNLGLHRRNTIVWWEHFPVDQQTNFPHAARFIHYYTRSPKNFCWNGDAIRVETVRQQIGDTRASEKGKIPDNVWQVERVVGNARERVPFPDHPPQVPEALLRRVILAASDEEDLILDPFAGNGTTGRAAISLGRKFLGIERSPKYASQARQWITAGMKGGK